MCLNTRYYSAHEFKTLTRHQSFNIFHSNLDGLENKYELLHNFIKSTSLDIDIINISETSHKLKDKFKSNILMSRSPTPDAACCPSAWLVLLIYFYLDFQYMQDGD